MFIFWLQDIISVAMEKILGRRGYVYRLVSKYYGLRERRALRRSDAIVAISDDFLPILRRWRIDPARISIIPNWAPIGDIPVGHKRNDWSRKYGVESGRLIVYAGTLGFKHSPRKLVDLAEAIKRHPDTRILVASEGAGAEYLKAEIGQRGLTNLQVIPFQPMEQFPDMLASADALVVLIERDAGVFSVPSKLLSYLCAKRAVLLSVPRRISRPASSPKVGPAWWWIPTMTRASLRRRCSSWKTAMSVSNVRWRVADTPSRPSISKRSPDGSRRLCRHG